MSGNITPSNYRGSKHSKTATDVAVSKKSPKPQVNPMLLKEMRKVKTDTPEAKLNKTSISDGEGGRIELNEPKNSGTIMGSINNRQW